MGHSADQTPGEGATVAVTVVRSGGFAGLRRQWDVEADARDADRWVALVEACPWDECTSGDRAAGGADRFAYRIIARVPGATRRADLAEAEVSGPWCTLIDAVHEASTATSGS